VAKDLAVAGMNGRIFDKYDKPEEVADFCLAIATRIVKYDADIDVDDRDY
jgi:hypothetical protein